MNSFELDSKFKLKPYLKVQQREIDKAMAEQLPQKHDFVGTLYAAMGHSMFSGGKRLRPILVLAAAEACGKSSASIMPAALSMECVHTYSLIHDDLPAMDNDDMRRGKPTCHKAFNEATAILAGDALLTFAFELMTKVKLSPNDGAKRILEAIRILSHASGMAGMVGGQLADLEAEGQDIDFPTLQYIHTHKTGYLIMASCQLGALLAGATKAQQKALTIYGESLGLAFQIADDILNVVGEASKLGKQTGTDATLGKATYPALVGLNESRELAGELIARGCKALKIFGKKATPLIKLAHYVIEREV